MFLGSDAQIKGRGKNLAWENSLYSFNEVKSKFLHICFKTMKCDDEDEPDILIYSV